MTTDQFHRALGQSTSTDKVLTPFQKEATKTNETPFVQTKSIVQ